MKRAAMMIGLAVIFVPPPAQAKPVSVYTKIDEKNCKTVQRAKEGDGEWTISRCKGRGGWQVFLDYDDAREALRLVRGGKEYRLPHGVGTFNSLGATIEWRASAKGAPAGVLIFRVRWKDQHTKKRRARLVVVRLGAEGACIVGTVDAHMTAINLRARRLADRHAGKFRCGRDKPIKLR
jgi:hypothetical protein